MTQELILIISLCGVGVLGIGFLIYKYRKGQINELYALALKLVDEAEAKFGNGTGQLKYEYVSEKLHEVLPGILKLVISEKVIDFIIERSVDELQEYLQHQLQGKE